MPPHGVMFHHFFDDSHPNGQGAISERELRVLLKYIGRNRILPADEWMRRALGGTLGESDVCLTFDDGLRCQYDVAYPVLCHLGLTAFWFIYSSVFEGNSEPLEVYRYFRTTAFESVDEFYEDFFRTLEDIFPAEYRTGIEGFDPDLYLKEFSIYSRRDRTFRYFRDEILGSTKYDRIMRLIMAKKSFDPQCVAGKLWMDDNNLRILRKAGHLIGLHSYTHPTRLAEQSAETQAAQYERNFEHLSRVLGERPVAMSHPCNSYNDLTLPILDRLGIRLGFRANMEAIASRSMFEFPRKDHAIIVKELRS